MNVVVGQRAQRTMTVTSDHVKTFAALTGDYNPLHFDEVFAARTKFGEAFDSLASDGYATMAGDRVTLSRDGLLRVDELIHDFFLPRHREVAIA